MGVLSLSFTTNTWDGTAATADQVLLIPAYTTSVPVTFSVSTDVLYSGVMEDGGDYYVYDAIGKKTANLKLMMDASQLSALLNLISISYDSTAYDWADTGWQYVSFAVLLDGAEYSEEVSSITRGVFGDVKYSPRGVDASTGDVYWDVSFSFREVDG